MGIYLKLLLLINTYLKYMKKQLKIRNNKMNNIQI